MKQLLLFLLFPVTLVLNAQANHWETAVYETDNWRYVTPNAEPDTNWRKVSFNASSWTQGPGGFGFGDGDDNTTFATNESVFIRIVFSIADTSKIAAAVLNADYDDGFVAYLNNVEIARTNISTAGRPPYNSLAAGQHEAVMYTGGNPDYFNISESTLEGLMLPGNNVLAIQVHNVATNSSDLSARFWLSFGITDASVFFGPTPVWFIAPLVFSSSDLPVVVINTGSNTIVDEPKVMADMGIIYNGPGNRNYLSDPFNNYNGKIGIEFRGSSSQGFPKKSYGFETWDVNGNAIDSSLVGMPKESDWILSASYSDKSLLNNFLSYNLAQSMGWYAPRCQHVELMINGEYKGVYVLMEKIKRDNDRVDIANLQPGDIAGDQVTGGYIIKIDKTTGNGGGGWTSAYAPDTNINGQTIYFQYEYPNDVDIMPQQEAYIQAYVDSFETALAGPNFADTSVGYAHYIDVNSFVDYFLLNELSRNVDGYRLSTYLYKDKTSNGGKLVIGPCWDYDIAWGNADYCLGEDPSGWAINFAEPCAGDYWQIPFWWDRLLQDTSFQNKVRCRWEELKQTVLSVNYLHNFCDSMQTYLTEGTTRNFTAWPILGTYVWPNPTPIPTTYAGEISELKNWISLRWAWMNANMPGSLSGCNLTSSPEQVASVSASVSGAYPNPFTNEVNFSLYLAQPDVITVTIYNSLGQEVIVPVTVQGTTGTNNVKIELPEDLPAGMYVMRVESGGKIWSQNISKIE
ncbi:MAG TPA: CotH kinase family protein [Bacteroidia bacterium]|nr:CotH kinase family protein [Bacteroidia bacterium]